MASKRQEMKHFLLQGSIMTYTSSSMCDNSQASAECSNIFFSLQNETSTGFGEF